MIRQIGALGLEYVSRGGSRSRAVFHFLLRSGRRVVVLGFGGHCDWRSPRSFAVWLKGHRFLCFHHLDFPGDFSGLERAGETNNLHDFE